MRQIINARYTFSLATPSIFGSMTTSNREIEPCYYERVSEMLESEGWRIIDSRTVSNNVIDDDESVIYVTVNTHIYMWNPEMKITTTIRKISEIEKA